MDPHSPRSHRVGQDVHHREGSAHESETKARHCDKTTFILLNDLGYYQQNNSRNQHCE